MLDGEAEQGESDAGGEFDVPQLTVCSGEDRQSIEWLVGYAYTQATKWILPSQVSIGSSIWKDVTSFQLTR